MTEPDVQRAADAGPRRDRRAQLAASLTAVAIAAALTGGLAWLAVMAQDRIEREERAWFERLDIIVEGRGTALEDWLSAQRDTIGGLADNDTLRLFITQLADAGYDLSNLGQAQAQKTYVANLLKASAQRAGYTGPIIGADIPANVESRATGGLSVIRPNGRVIVTTRGAAAPELPDRAADATAPAFLGQVADPEGEFAVAFYAPVFGIQADPEPGEALAYVVGYRRAGDALRARLATDVAIADSLRTMLLTERDGRVRPSLAAPQFDDETARPEATADAAALAFAWRNAGTAGQTRAPDGTPVLISARDVPQTPWRLATLVARDDAVGDEIARARRTAIGLGLAAVAATLAMLALWRHGTSVRAQAATERYRETARRLEAERRLLKTITDNQPTVILICDADSRVGFANARAGETAGTAPADLLGKSFAAVFGPAVAQRLRDLNEEARRSGELVTRRLTERDGVRGVWLSDHIPLPGSADAPGDVLVVQHDISSEVAERARRERTLSGLIDAIMKIVDQRDHRTGHRSRMLARVAETLAHEAGASARECEAARLAGTLMNLGKVLVPEDVLERAGPLSADEMAQIRASTVAVARLVSDLEFDAPVQQTLDQVHERIDGSGQPEGLEGEAIVLPARAVAVANAFVGMITERPDRPALSVDTALEHLWAAVDTAFDRAIVGALVNLVRNRGLTEALESA